jgi:hypothetical protein
VLNISVGLKELNSQMEGTAELNDDPSTPYLWNWRRETGTGVATCHTGVQAIGQTTLRYSAEIFKRWRLVYRYVKRATSGKSRHLVMMN